MGPLWSVKKLRSCATSVGWGRSQSYRLRFNYRNYFIRVGSESKNTVQISSSVGKAVSLVQGSPWSAACWRCPCLAWLLGSVDKYEPNQPFSTGTFILWVNILSCKLIWYKLMQTKNWTYLILLHTCIFSENKQNKLIN